MKIFLMLTTPPRRRHLWLLHGFHKCLHTDPQCLLEIPSRCCWNMSRCPVGSLNIDRVKFPSVKSRTKVKEKHYNKENQIKLHHCKNCVSCLIHSYKFFLTFCCEMCLSTKTSILVMVACNHRHCDVHSALENSVQSCIWFRWPHYTLSCCKLHFCRIYLYVLFFHKFYNKLYWLSCIRGLAVGKFGKFF